MSPEDPSDTQSETSAPEWVADEASDAVVLDDSGDEWVLVADDSETPVSLEAREEGWALVDDEGEEYAVITDESDASSDNDGTTAGAEAGVLDRERALQLAGGGIVAASLVGVGGRFAAGDDPDSKGVSITEGLDGVDFDYPTALSMPFAHGVASGDPLPTRVILWTRLTYEEPPERRFVDYEVGTDPEFSEVITEGTIQTGPARDWTVKADATGLEPGTTYYYRFHTEEATSIVGRTRTAPVGDVSELRFGVVACTSYWSGHFNGYGRLADRDSLDLILHVGDYVYDFPDPQEFRRARHDIFDEEYVDFRRWETLEEVRRRYALYYSDPDQVRVHQQHPFAVVWDNHETAVTDDTELTPADVRQAFWEWTPTRPVVPDGSGDPLPPTDGYVEPEDNRYLYRRLPYGNLADVLMMDQQQWRAPGESMYDEERTMLGDEQFEWLTDAMIGSSEAGTTWRILGNQKYIAPFRAANLPERVPVFDRDALQQALLYNDKQWDGYPVERARLFERMRAHDVDDTIFATGDMHMNWGADVTEDPTGNSYDGATGTGETHSVGVSFAPSSISRGGGDESVRGVISGPLSEEMTRRLTAGLTRFATNEIDATNAHVQFIEWIEHGYGIAHLTPEEARLEYWWTPLMPRTPQQELGAQLRVPRTDTTEQLRNHAIRVADPTPTTGARADRPAPPPEELDGF
jgi:alkaline phosphatase D